MEKTIEGIKKRELPELMSFKLSLFKNNIPWLLQNEHGHGYYQRNNIIVIIKRKRKQKNVQFLLANSNIHVVKTISSITLTFSIQHTSLSKQ